ncbi:CMRF35-like molecule 8 [Carlito syrichta]|uniref:CMRF35-like molecule 8 n=1 Tax=Carlito syrichta TaxID=1868482 RepID=A0A3Q0EC96_CARSF|nr:CMRF35-like molecule 8 [Carlito syrichta]
MERSQDLGLCFPGCLSLSGPRTVTGTVGGSLNVQCQYEATYRSSSKYWCRKVVYKLCEKVVETKEPEREERHGRVSIRDHPAQLAFMVTMWNLTEEDADTYWCQINKNLLDLSFQVKVSVFPGTTVAKTWTITTTGPPESPTTLSAVSPTHSASFQGDHEQRPRSQLPLLLSLLALLLLLLVGTSLMAWGLLQKQLKAGESSALSQNPRQAAPREELHYASVVFDSQSQGSNRISVQRTQEEEPEYSVIRKTQAFVLPRELEGSSGPREPGPAPLALTQVPCP